MHYASVSIQRKITSSAVHVIIIFFRDFCHDLSLNDTRKAEMIVESLSFIHLNLVFKKLHHITAAEASVRIFFEKKSGTSLTP